MLMTFVYKINLNDPKTIEDDDYYVTRIMQNDNSRDKHARGYRSMLESFYKTGCTKDKQGRQLLIHLGRNKVKFNYE